MARILCSVIVRADPATIFDFISDPDHHSLWQRDLLRRVEPTPNLVEGSSWTEFRRLGSRELKIGVTVTGSSRPHRITYVGESGNFHGRGVIEFHAEGQRTRVVHHTQFRGRGVSAVLTPFIARQARRTMQANLFRLTLRFAQAAA